MRDKLITFINSLVTEKEKKFFTDSVIDSIIYNLKEDGWEIGIEAIVEEGLKNQASNERRKFITGSIVKAMEDLNR